MPRSFVPGALLCGFGPLLLAQGSWEDMELEGGIQATVVEAAAPRHAVFTILPHGLLADGPGEEQLSHLAEHMLIRSTDPDSLEAGGMLLNGETTALALRLESIGPPATWRDQLERHARWLSASEIDPAVLEREKGRIRGEEVHTVRAGFTHKWAEVAWNQVVRHGRASASVSGTVERAGADDVAKFIARLPRSGRGVRIVSVGPAPAAEVKEAIRGLLAGSRGGGGGAPAPPAAGADAVRKVGPREATWDLDARHWMEWYTLPDGGPGDRAAAQVLAALLGQRLATNPGLSTLGSKAFASADLVTPEGRWLAVSASVPAGVDLREVEAAIRAALEGSLRPAFGSPGPAGIARSLADQVSRMPDVSAMRRLLAGKQGGDHLEIQHVLSAVYREVSAGLSREDLARAIQDLEPSRVEALARERLTPAMRSTLLIRAAPEEAEPPDGEGFVPLFNGKDLSGWVNVNGAPGTWTVRDGMIVTTGKPICVLRTEKPYEDFVVELEWRHMVKGGNAGFFVWSDALPARGQPFTRSIECQIIDGRESENATSHGDVFAIHGAVMTPDRPHPAGWARCLPSEKRSRPSPGWNHYRVTCRQGTLKLAVNGKEVSGGHGIRPRKGYLCLESEGSEAHFRNIRIRELEPPATGTPLAPEDIAGADEGFRPIYTGVDLNGWKVAEGDAAHWKPDDWRLDFDGEGGTIWTEEEFGDFILIADCRAVKAPVPGDPATVGEFSLFLRGRTECEVRMPAARDTGWRRAVVRVKGETVRVELDGKLVTETATCSEARRGPIGIGRKGGAVELANLLVKPLP